MTTGCYETSLLLFANARGVGTLLTVKCAAHGTHRETNARGLPGGGCSRLELTHTLPLHILRYATGNMQRVVFHSTFSSLLALNSLLGSI